MSRRRKYTKEILQEAAKNSTSVAGVLRYLGLNQTGGMHAHISRSLKQFGIHTSHFIRYQGGPGRVNKLRPEQIFVVRVRGSRRAKPAQLRRALLEIGRLHVCAECGIGATWQGKPLSLHVDHIDGDYHNNLAENLRFLCPNCHSQTGNFAGASRGKYTGRYTQIDFDGGAEKTAKGAAMLPIN